MNVYHSLLCGGAVAALYSGAAMAEQPLDADKNKLILAQAQGTSNAEPAPTAAQVTASDVSGYTGATDIIVTAQRRAEPLQKVPIAITAIQPAQIEEQNITDLVSLRSKVATFDFRSTGLSAGIYIRGVGQNGALPNQENSVALYVDDVYLGLAQMTKQPFNNIEQLVVLKGPQGTLFGRNATGGVIQVLTASPKHDASLDANIGYGNYDTVKGSLYATGGLSDKIAANLSLVYENQGKGWGRNLFLDEEILYKKTFGVRSKILFEPAEGTEILLSADYNYEYNTGLDTRPVPGNPRFDVYPPDAGYFDTYAGFPDKDTLRHGGVSMKLTQELGFANLVSITAYRKMKAFQSVDQDSTPASVVSVHSFFRGSQFTQEVQLLSNEDSKLKWTLGAFYLHATPFFGQDFFEISRHLEARQLTNSIAVYGQATYPIFDGTNITGGLRYTRETQKLVDAFRVQAGVTTIFPELKNNSNKPTWRLSLDQQLTENILAYVSYNRGIKTGGTNLNSPALPPYLPEQLDAYEVGLKTQLFDRRMRFNVAAFYYDYTNLQVAQAIVGSSLVANAATARIYGVDGDIDIQATREFSLYGNFGFLNSKYTDYQNAQVSTITGAAIPGYDATGNDLIYAPHFTGGAGARYQTETEIGEITLAANVNYYGGAFGTADEQSRIPAYTLVNASIQWASPSRKFDVRLWGANLTDKRWLEYAVQNSVGLMVRPGQPRTYGISIGVHY